MWGQLEYIGKEQNVWSGTSGAWQYYGWQNGPKAFFGNSYIGGNAVGATKELYGWIKGWDIIPNSMKIRCTGYLWNSGWPPDFGGFTCPCSNQDHATRPGIANGLFAQYYHGYLYEDGGDTYKIWAYDDLYNWYKNGPDHTQVYFKWNPRGCQIACTKCYTVTAEIIEIDGQIIGMPTAIDIAKTNENWIYIGLSEKIIKSEDAGATWAVLTSDYGADDIAVHPMLAGHFVFHATDGNLYQCTVGVVDTTPLDTGRRIAVPRRLAFDPHGGGKLWSLTLDPTDGESRRPRVRGEQRHELAQEPPRQPGQLGGRGPQPEPRLRVGPRRQRL